MTGDEVNMQPSEDTINEPGPIPPDDIRYRVIANKELTLLTPLFLQLGWPAPDPTTSKAVVAQIGTGPDSLICGFAMVQFVVHNEPMWVHPGMRGTGIAEGLADAVTHYIEEDCHIKRYVCSAKEGSFAARLAEKHGMHLWQGMRIYVKQLE